MTDLNPEIWENKTLGRASKNQRLDVLEAQQIENRSAELEGRTPRKVVAENDHPAANAKALAKIKPSYASVLHFEDERDEDIPRPEGATKPHTTRKAKSSEKD